MKVELMQRILLLLAALFMLTTCSNEIKQQALPADSVVLALGDSLTAGAGVNADEAWPALLAARTQWNIINGGVSGDTSEAALQRLPSLLAQHDPVLVIVTLGGNDMLRHLPPQETIANLNEIINLVRAHGAKAILLATPNPSVMGAVFQHLSAADFYKNVAKAQQVPLIENAIAEVLSNPDLKVDALHPNAAGHRLLANKILGELNVIGYSNAN
ncbi:MAG: arylesterase [Gallionella sp.]